MTTNNFPGVGYTNYGKDFNYFNKLTISATTFGGTSADGYQPDIVIPFSTYTIMMINHTAAGTGNTFVTGGVIEYSFNGTTVHGELGSCFQNIALTFENRSACKIWFRIQSGSGGTPVVSTQAWSIR